MVEQPLVSIIIPCYNGERFLRAAIDSALAQDYKHVQVVVVDDGSTDDSASVLAHYGTKIKAVSQSNGGLSAARNRGVRESSGTHILLLDADDILLPSCASSRLSLMAGRTNVGIVTGKTSYIDENGEMISDAVDMKPTYENAEITFVDAMRRFPGPPTGWLIPRYVFQTCGYFDEDQRIAEDLEFCLRVLSAHTCLCDPSIQTLYREVSGSLSRNYALNYDFVRLAVRKNAGKAPIGGFEFWWNRNVLLLNSVAGTLTRTIRSRNPKATVRFLISRPSALPFAVLFGFRALFNRLLSIFGKGPISKKRAALSQETAP